MSGSPEISFVIPSYNEQHRLPGTVRAVIEHMDAARPASELVLVDDGSTDSTARVIRQAADGDERIVPVFLERNAGKGGAVRAGVERVRGRVVVFFDADLSYPLAGIDGAVSRIERGADVVIGARDLAVRDSRWRYSPFRRVATGGFNAVVEWMIGLGVGDTQCGFKAFRHEAAKALFGELRVQSFAFDIELLFLARLWSLRVERMPVEMTHAHGSTIRLVRDSARMLSDVWAIRRRARGGLYPSRPEGL